MCAENCVTARVTTNPNQSGPFVRVELSSRECRRLSLALELLSLSLVSVIEIHPSSSISPRVELRIDPRLKPPLEATARQGSNAIAVCMAPMAIGTLKVFLLRGHVQDDVFDVPHLDFAAKFAVGNTTKSLDISIWVEDARPPLRPEELRRSLR